MIRLSQVTLIRGTKTLLEDADVALNPGDKIGLIGPNGSGKSSLFALLRAERLLHGLGFSHGQMEQPVASFSGGWRMRLNLAQALMCPSDLLLLDEPTNHLDLETREALTVALAQFEGTLVLVSHDRHLLRATTDQFLIVADGRLQAFDGDLDDYRDWLFRTKLADPEETVPLPAPRGIEVPLFKKDPAPARPAAAAPPAAGRRGQKRKEAAERQRISAARKPLESRLKRLDEQMAKLNEKKSALEAQLADPAIYGEAQTDALKALILDQAYVARELAELEAEWLALQEQLETSN